MITVHIIFALLLAGALAVLLWPVREQHKFALVVVLIFFTGAFGLYALVGSPGMIPLMEAHEKKLAVLKESILRDSETLKREPKNLAAWVGLGQAFMETGQYDAAANAFKQAVKLSGGDPQLILAYARAMILAADGEVSDHAKKSLEMVLLQEPRNPEARYFLAVRKLQDGKTQEAMKEMKELYRSLPKDSPIREMMDRQRGR